jgi:Tfp pilus assembly protein PilN
MALQFNLLPDVKLEFDRAQRTKKLVYALSGLATGITIALFVVSFLSVNVLQKKLLNDANGDITNYSQKLKSIPDLDKVLTIQNQLNSLPGLHQKKHITSRLFTYLPELTPTNINIGKLNLDTTANTISITGTADAVETINKFVDTLKFTTYTVGGDQTKQIKAFSNVILTKVDRNDKNASYTIDASFDPVLFDAASVVALVVPQEVTTRSILNTPSASNPLFNGQTGKPTTPTSGGQ